MSAFHERLAELEETIALEETHPYDRIRALCEKALLVKDTHEVAKCLRDILEEVEVLDY